MIEAAPPRLAIHRPNRSLRKSFSSPYDCFAWCIPVMVEHHAGRVGFRKLDPAFCFLSVLLRHENHERVSMPAPGAMAILPQAVRVMSADHTILSPVKMKRPAHRRPFLT
jgi:hypothetical protein